MNQRRKFTNEFKINIVERSKTRANISELTSELGYCLNNFVPLAQEFNYSDKPAFTGAR